MLRCSDGRWVEDTSIRVGAPITGDTDDFDYATILGVTSGATAQVKRLETTTEGGQIVKELYQLVKESKSIIIASPIYMYDLNAAAKNFMELTGRAWTKKIVGFICAAGGKGSYMSVTSYMNSLMLDFRCIVIPRFVYTDGSGFDENYNIKSNIKERIKELVDQTTLLSSKIED